MPVLLGRVLLAGSLLILPEALLEVGKSMLADTHPCVTESKFRILYLGADLELVAALNQALPKPEYRLVACSEQGSARLFLESEIPYDVLLIDFDWQGEEGLKMTQLANRLSHRKGMPILLVSKTELSSQLKKFAKKSGVSEFVVKDAAKIGEMIRRRIEK